MHCIPISLVAITIMAGLSAFMCQVQIPEEGRHWIVGETYHVHIVNGLEKRPKLMKVHCRSADDDLGTHVLWVDQEYFWRFKINVFGSTLFYCDVKRGQRPKHFVAFNTSVEGLSCFKTGQCYWLIADKGFYFSMDDYTWEKKFGW
ncbi:plant self-incompatibility protein S1 family [Striga asiatica]|uniref:S-protein homolog n=1 Tax=Striga asiatica TaxID=4170 RepID=A0A5A7QXK7_STRAF|nr:plant self-incompatibility protein S1 family [Striga asiatica]